MEEGGGAEGASYSISQSFAFPAQKEAIGLQAESHLQKLFSGFS